MPTYFRLVHHQMKTKTAAAASTITAGVASMLATLTIVLLVGLLYTVSRRRTPPEPFSAKVMNSVGAQVVCESSSSDVSHFCHDLTVAGRITADRLCLGTGAGGTACIYASDIDRMSRSSKKTANTKIIADSGVERTKSFVYAGYASTRGDRGDVFMKYAEPNGTGKVDRVLESNTTYLLQTDSPAWRHFSVYIPPDGKVEADGFIITVPGVHNLRSPSYIKTIK